MWQVAVDDRRVRYLITGVGASAVYYLVFTTGWLLSAGRIHYVAMAIVANLVTAAVTYRLYRDGVFRVGAHPRRGGRVRGFLRFYLICLWSLALTLVGLPLLVEVGGLPVLLAQALIIAGSPILNYQVHRLWGFSAVRAGRASANGASPGQN